MGFTFGAKSQINISTANPVVLSHTTVVNTKLLVIGIMTKTIIDRAGTAPTYNGVTMTRVAAVIGAAECTSELWYLSNPAIGTYNVSVPNPDALIITVIASSYVNAAVTGAALDQYNSTNVSVANPSLSVTTGFADEVIVDVFGSGLNALAHTPNKTLLYQKDEGVWCSNAQYELKAIAGLTTFTWTCAIDDVAFIVGAFKGITGTPTGFNKLQYSTEPPTTGAWNKLKYVSEPPVPAAWNKLAYTGE